MTYTLLPNSGQSLGQTRSSIRTNFQLIQSAQDTNHVALGTVGAGKHKFVQMPEQGSAPTTAVNEGALYTKVGTSPAETQLFYRAENSGFEYRLTRPDSSNTASFAVNTNGWTFLPGGLILQYGTVATPGTSGTITFPKAFTTTFLSIQFTVKRDTASSGVATYAVTQATPLSTADYKISNSGATTLFWWALGI